MLLKDENLGPAFSVEELAAQTEGYSGSDLKNMCVAAAYRPIRELIAAEKAAAEQLRRGAAVKEQTVQPGEEEDETGTAGATAAQEDGQPVISSISGGEALCTVGVRARLTAASEQSLPARGTTPEAASALAAASVAPLTASVQAPPLRALKLEDFKAAMQQVGPSVSSDQGSLITELRRWNEVYGEGGKRKADTLTYFL